MEYAVITGTSRGLGARTAKSFLEKGINVIGVARSPSEGLDAIAVENNVTFTSYACDLRDPDTVENTSREIVALFREKNPETVYIIHNAAALEPVGKAGVQDTDDIRKHVEVNTLAPMITMNIFLHHLTKERIPLKGMIITSGAAESPIYGWSAYCSSKASMNMYVRTVAIEQEKDDTSNKLVAFSPGIMDTAMQEKIRSTSEDDFRDVERFRHYKEKGMLADPQTVAEIIAELMLSDTLENGRIYDVSEFLR